MPLVTDCAWCGQRFTTEAGTVACPHCSQSVTVVRPSTKVPTSDYWQLAKFLVLVFLAAVLLFAFASSFLH